jgi:hypothetical protein
MKKLLLATVAVLAMSAASAQTLPPVSITSASASRDDLSALRSVIDANIAERKDLELQVKAADVRLNNARNALANVGQRLDRGDLLMPPRPLSHEELTAYVAQQDARRGFQVNDGLVGAGLAVRRGNTPQWQ